MGRPRRPSTTLRVKVEMNSDLIGNWEMVIVPQIYETKAYGISLSQGLINLAE